jgi:glycosyltransferase involved in cell wall biosynthesis
VLRVRRMIGVWAWELSRVPAEWAVGAKFVHEIWAPSRFSAEAFEAIAPGRVRVVPFPLATQLPFSVAGDRAAFGLPADHFIVFSAFNLASSCTRKNPFGTIAAFKAAFGASRDALLVLKLTGVADYQDDLAAIGAAVGEAPNIRLVTETVSEPELRGLMAASDVVLSLHRSEGFGLIPATAALLGVPVVATGYSGNLAFMEPQSSGLVRYRLVPVRDERGVYDIPNAEWAEPDVEDAAAWLRRLFENPALRAEMGAAGQRHAMSSLGRGALDAALAANGIE